MGFCRYFNSEEWNQWSAEMNQRLNLSHLHYLDEFLLFNSDGYHIIKDKISHYLCPHQFEVDEASSLNIHLNSFSFGNSALYDVKYSTAVTITIDETSPHYLFRINLEGHCQVEHEKNSGNVVTWHLLKH
jgi:hypothetical protein